MNNLSNIMEKMNNNYKTREFSGKSQLGEILFNIIQYASNCGALTPEMVENIMLSLPSETMLQDQGVSYVGLDEYNTKIARCLEEYKKENFLTNDSALVKRAA